MKLKIGNRWWTAPAEAANGNLILVTGRYDLWNVQADGHYIYRVDITWPYEGDKGGMPGNDVAALMDEVDNALRDTFDRDPVAVLCGIYTGDGERNWVLYTRSLHIFRRKINEALAPFDTLPLQFHAEEDPDWNEYRNLCDTEIPDED